MQIYLQILLKIKTASIQVIRVFAAVIATIEKNPEDGFRFGMS